MGAESLAQHGFDRPPTPPTQKPRLHKRTSKKFCRRHVGSITRQRVKNFSRAYSDFSGWEGWESPESLIQQGFPLPPRLPPGNSRVGMKVGAQSLAQQGFVLPPWDWLDGGKTASGADHRAKTGAGADPACAHDRRPRPCRGPEIAVHRKAARVLFTARFMRFSTRSAGRQARQIRSSSSGAVSFSHVWTRRLSNPTNWTIA